MGSLDFKLAIEELKSSVEYLRSSGSPTVGCIGFCMGGALTFCAAQFCGVECAAPFYGVPNESICNPEEIKIPLQAHFGKLDTQMGLSDLAVRYYAFFRSLIICGIKYGKDYCLVCGQTAKAVESKMISNGCNCSFLYYDDVGHGFMNKGEAADKLRECKKLNILHYP